MLHPWCCVPQLRMAAQRTCYWQCSSSFDRAGQGPAAGVTAAWTPLGDERPHQRAHQTRYSNARCTSALSCHSTKHSWDVAAASLSWDVVSHPSARCTIVTQHAATASVSALSGMPSELCYQSILLSVERQPVITPESSCAWLVLHCDARVTQKVWTVRTVSAGHLQLLPELRLVGVCWRLRSCCALRHLCDSAHL